MKKFIITAIYSSILCRFKNIYLYGVEHDWIKNIIIDKENNLYIKKNHFYDNNNEISRI